MTIPPFLLQPSQPPTERRGTAPPFVIDQRPGPNNTVRVTWSLPGLRRATVTFPEHVWLNGDHAAIGHALAPMLDALIPDMADDADTADATTID